MDISTITEHQAQSAVQAIRALATAQGVTPQELAESASQFGGGGALVEHVRRVERQTGREYTSLPWFVADLLEHCRIIAGALAHTCLPHEWAALDRAVWHVATEALSS